MCIHFRGTTMGGTLGGHSLRDQTFIISLVSSSRTSCFIAAPLRRPQNPSRRPVRHRQVGGPSLPLPCWLQALTGCHGLTRSPTQSLGHGHGRRGSVPLLQKNYSVIGYSVPFMFPISSRIPTALQPGSRRPNSNGPGTPGGPWQPRRTVTSVDNLGSGITWTPGLGCEQC